MKISFRSVVFTVLVWILAFVVVEIFRLLVWQKMITPGNQDCNCSKA